MKQVVPQEMRRSFSELLVQLDSTGDDDRADYTRIFCLALLNELSNAVDRVVTLDFLSQYADRKGLS
jgi:hypothetical protein